MRIARRRLLPVLACLALLVAGGQAFAQVRQMSADGGGSCPDAGAGSERLDDADADPATATNRRAQKAKPAVVAPRGSTRPAAPRWHSFLPGMFR